MFADDSSVRIDVSRAITLAINSARDPPSLVRVLVTDEISKLITFDSCNLVLPNSAGGGVRVWRASRSAGRESADGFSQEGGSILRRLLEECACRLLDDKELSKGRASELGDGVHSALALPLSFGGSSFGLVCFTSTKSNAYRKGDPQRLMWLADLVAACAHASLLQARLDLATEKLREMERMKAGFVNTLVRDIRLPLTGLLALLRLLESKQQGCEPLERENRHAVRNAIESGDRIQYVLDDHLEIARQDEQPLALTIEDWGIEGLLEDAAEPLRGEAALRGVELIVNVAGPSLSVHADARQTRRALCHLFTIALAATPDGGVINIASRTIVSTRREDEGKRFIAILISDSRHGLADEAPILFDSLWQVPDRRMAGFKGIGLAIARRIALAHGGNVSVRSGPSEGSVYSLVLPASPQCVVSEVPRILVVDDSPDLLALLQIFVTRMGYQVEAAACADDALDILRKMPIDLVLTDWSMPGMTGGELIGAMKESESLRRVPIIVLTGHDTDEVRQAAKDCGSDEFLVKPVVRNVLEGTINKLLPTFVTR